MQEVLLFDRARKPPIWSDLMREGQYVAFVSDARTDAPMTSDGRVTPDRARTCLIFDSLDEATAYCRTQTQQRPRLRFDVFDSRGRAGPPVAVIVSCDSAGTVDTERKARRLIRLGLLLMALSPFPIWFDWRAGWSLIVPTFFGLQAIVAGLRCIQLGYSRIEGLRAGTPRRH